MIAACLQRQSLRPLKCEVQAALICRSYPAVNSGIRSSLPTRHCYLLVTCTIHRGPGLDLLLLCSFVGKQFPLQPLHLLCQVDPTFGDQLEIASLDCIILGLPGSLSCLDCPSSILLCPCIHDSRQCEAGNSPAKSVVRTANGPR